MEKKIYLPSWSSRLSVWGGVTSFGWSSARHWQLHHQSWVGKGFPTTSHLRHWRFSIFWNRRQLKTSVHWKCQEVSHCLSLIHSNWSPEKWLNTLILTLKAFYKIEILPRKHCSYFKFNIRLFPWLQTLFHLKSCHFLHSLSWFLQTWHFPALHFFPKFLYHSNDNNPNSSHALFLFCRDWTSFTLMDLLMFYFSSFIFLT